MNPIFTFAFGPQGAEYILDLAEGDDGELFVCISSLGPEHNGPCAQRLPIGGELDLLEVLTKRQQASIDEQNETARNEAELPPATAPAPREGWNCGNQNLHSERTMRLLETRPRLALTPALIEAIDNLAYECGPEFCQSELGRRMAFNDSDLPF
jgi:hypothetical protein